MNKYRRTAFPALLVLSILTLTGCDATNDDTGIFIGDGKALGNGSALAFITLDGGRPTAFGVRIDSTALLGLSAHQEVEMTLPFPTNVKNRIGPVDHVTLGWNPHGHEPAGVYDLPHFDLHFYLMTEAERAAIDPAAPDFAAKADKTPAAQYVPAGYVGTPGAVPRMGAHWVDPASPEFTPAGFSRTFIYGFWDGHMNFLEPMITRAFLESLHGLPGKKVTVTIPQPQAYAAQGYYPTRYSVEFDANRKAYVITLDRLRSR